MTIRGQVRAYIAANPQAKPRHIVADLKLTVRQVENALRVIRHGAQTYKPKRKTHTPQPASTHVLQSVWR